jgi:hypothetical protein
MTTVQAPQSPSAQPSLLPVQALVLAQPLQHGAGGGGICLFAQGALVPELDGSCFHAMQPMGVCDPQTPAQGASPLDPDPLFFAPPKKRGGKRKAAPHCARPLGLRPRGFPALLEARPRPELAALACGSLRSNRLAESEGSRAYGTRAGLLCCSAAQRGWNTQIPNIRTSARCLQSTSRGPAVGCWLLPAVCAAEQRRQGGPRAAGTHPF